MIPPDLYARVRRIHLRMRGLVQGVAGGAYHAAFKGRGMTFSEVRRYAPGDDVRTIDWNVSARTGETHVKVYQEERELTVLLLIDVSGSIHGAPGVRAPLDLAAEATALMALSAAQLNDPVGMILFTDRVEHLVPPRRGHKHALRLVRDLLAHTPQSRSTNLAEATSRALHLVRHRSLVVVMSDFQDPNLKDALSLLARKHDVVAFHLDEEALTDLPVNGLVLVRDAEGEAWQAADLSHAPTRRALADQIKRRHERVRKVLRALQIDTVSLRSAEPPADTLLHFFDRRKRLAG